MSSDRFPRPITSVPDVPRQHDHHGYGDDSRYDDRYDDGRYDDEFRGGAGITEIVVVGSRVLDVRERPLAGSEYEHLARSMGAVPEPQVRTVRVEVPAPPLQEQMRDWLCRVVGGAEALAGLDDRPLPREPLDVSGLKDDRLVHRLRVIDELLTNACESVAAPHEVLTAARRLLRRTPDSPHVLGEESRPEQAAGAVLWAVLRASDLLGPRGLLVGAAFAQQLGARSLPSGAGARLVRAVAGDAWPYGYRPAGVPDVPVLGAADLLVASFRRSLLAYAEQERRVRAEREVLMSP